MAAKKQHTRRSNTSRSGKPGAMRTAAHSATMSARATPVGLGDWFAAARPATLGLSLAPVILGWGVAAYELLLAGVDPFNWSVVLVAGLAALLAVLLQVGVNFANDYSDGIRGTDRHRVGPRRLTASGEVEPSRVRFVALAFLALAAVDGIVLVVLTEQWWLSAVGALALVAAWFYTGGKRPYGYAGLGEVVVFLFFGLVATTGTSYLIIGTFPSESVLAGVAMGCFASAVLHINNVRDRATDIDANKRTLATRLPAIVNRALFTVLAIAPFGLLLAFSLSSGLGGYAFFALCFAAPAILIAWMAATPKDHVLALKLTVWSSLAFAVLVAWSIVA